MPKWAGKWQGGRFYLDELNRPVYFVERRGRVVRLATHDETEALAELARFLDDPAAFDPPVRADRRCPHCDGRIRIIPDG